MDEREIADRESFVHWVSTEWRPDDGAELLEKDWPRFAFAAWQAARRTTPDMEAVVRAGEDVVVTNVPNRIYLNLGDIYEMGELPFQQLTDVTWCEDRIDDTDIEYVRVAAPTSDKGGA